MRVTRRILKFAITCLVCSIVTLAAVTVLAAPSNETPGSRLDRLRAERAKLRAHIAAASTTTAVEPSDVAALDDGVWANLSISDRAGHVSVYDAPHDRMIVFGGENNEGVHNDVWALSMTAAHPWTNLATVGTPPAQAAYANAVLDAQHHRMVVLGDGGRVWTLALNGKPRWTELSPSGTAPTLTGRAIYDPIRDRALMLAPDAVWALSLSGPPKWTMLIGTGGGPGARILPVVIYDSLRDRMLVFGGDDNNFPLPTDVWALPLSGTPAWAAVSTTGTPPDGRVAAAAIYDAASDRMIVHGGTDGFIYLDDAWSLSLSGTPAWTDLAPAGTSPFRRAFHTAVLDTQRNRMVIFSGSGEIHGPPDRNDVWALALTGSPAWSPVLGTSPEPRAWHAASYDPVRDRMIVFGGDAIQDGAPENNELWTVSLDRSPVWNEMHPTGSIPGARSYPSMVYDPVRDRMLILGGENSGQPYNDVWALSLAGTPSMAQLQPGGTAPPDIRCAIYDAGNDRVVALAQDVSAWALSLGSTPQWTALNATSNDPVLGGVSAIYDPVRNRLVTPGGGYLWALPLSGAPVWARSTATGSPQIDAAYEMTYDSLRDRLVFMGGYYTSEKVFAISLSGGTAWEPLDPAGPSPMGRHGHTAIYDPLRDRLVVFGGMDFYRERNDAWTLAFSAPPTLALTLPRSADGLQACYPNPFNPRVTIPLRLSNDGNATVIVYDVSGHVVRTLVSGWTSRGAHLLSWDGTNASGSPVSSGVYFARLHTANVTATQKLVLLK